MSLKYKILKTRIPTFLLLAGIFMNLFCSKDYSQQRLPLEGKKVAVFIADLFNEREFLYPYYRMKEAGAEVIVVGPSKTTFNSEIGMSAKAEKDINEVKAEDFDAVIIPGGYSPDKMRRSKAMVDFVKKMNEQEKIVAAICHGPWMCISADILKGKRATSFFSIKVDMMNAGAEWVDEEVVKDDNLITSRNPNDLPAFCRTIISAMSK